MADKKKYMPDVEPIEITPLIGPQGGGGKLPAKSTKIQDKKSTKIQDKKSTKIQDQKFKQFKKIINKTPNKKLRQDKTYELSTGKFGKIISGKTQKKKIIQQETEIKRNFEAKGQEWKSPIKLQGGGAATHGLGRAFLKGGKV